MKQQQYKVLAYTGFYWLEDLGTFEYIEDAADALDAFGRDRGLLEEEGDEEAFYFNSLIEEVWVEE